MAIEAGPTAAALSLIPGPREASRPSGIPGRAPRTETPNPTVRAQLERLRVEELELSAELRRLSATAPRMVDTADAEDRDAAERLAHLAETLRATLAKLEGTPPLNTRSLLRVHDVRRQLVVVLGSQLARLRGLAGEGLDDAPETTGDLHGAAA